MTATDAILRAVHKACGDADRATVSVNTLASAAGVSRRTAIKALQALESEGEIRREGEGTHTRTIVLVQSSRGIALAEYAAGWRTDDAPGLEYTPFRDELAALADRLAIARARGMHGLVAVCERRLGEILA